MTDYVKSTDFAAKDALVSGNPAKIVQGTEIDLEFDNIAIAIASKLEAVSGGTVVGPSGATDNALVRFDNNTGNLIQNSAAILTDAGALSGVTMNGNVITAGTVVEARLPNQFDNEKQFDGTVGIGGANPSSGNWNLYCKNNSANPGAVFFTDNTSAYAQVNIVGLNKTKLILFQKSDDSTIYGNYTDVGSIQTSGSSTSYNTSSDYRLKTNVTPMTGAIARVKNLAPVRFNWLSDLTAPAVDGFIAHEVSAVVPEAITGVKDDVYPDGRIMPQGIDQAKLVPLLVAALQEAIARIEALEAA